MDPLEHIFAVILLVLVLVAFFGGYSIGMADGKHMVVDSCQKAGAAKSGADYYSCTMVKK